MFVWAGGEYLWIKKINFVGRFGFEMLQTSNLGLNWCSFGRF